MSLRDCINRAVAAGEMDPGRANRAQGLFDELEAEFRGRMNRDEAARQAAAKTLEAVKREAAERARQTLLQIRVARARIRDLQVFRDARGEEDLGGALLAILDQDELARFSNVEARRKAIRGRLHARMEEVLFTFRRDLIGRVRNKAKLENLVREAFGENTGDAAARELARAWSEAAEFGRLRYNAAGGHIPRRADWGMPQHHDTLAVRRVTFEEWRDFIAPRLDPRRMVDEQTGLPLSGERLELALRQVYETIRTDGFNKLTPSGVPVGSKLANRRADHRFLVFRSAEAWLQYQERFGGADPFSAMMAHLDGMSRDIARMEILGPNDRATLRFLEQTVERAAVEKDVAAGGGTSFQDRARGQIKLANDMFASISGGANVPINGRIARTFAGLRAFLTSTQLGAAALSAITDLSFQRMAARHAGLPQVATMGRVLKLLNPVDPADRKLAVRLGLIAEHWSSVAMAHARYVGEIQAPEIAARLSDFILRISGLSPWTQAGRWAFGMEFLGHLADVKGLRFAELRPELRSTLQRYGIGSDAWSMIRATDPYEFEGATFLRPDDVASRADLAPQLADDLATRMLEMVQSETEFAVPSQSLRGRAWMVSDLQPGTLQGELIRSFAMYKSFAVSLAFTHIRRGLLQKGALAKGQYFANLTISATLFGALALNLKEISKGRDPRPMNTPEFWGAALLQGGGLGIFGDFLFADVNRFDRGLAETVAGPVVGFFNDVRRLSLGNLVQLPGEDPTNFGRELTNFLRRYTPGGSVWYARLAYERLVLDELQRFVDPRAGRRFRQLERRYRREFGQRFFWKPGQTLPQRPPDFGSALGE